MALSKPRIGLLNGRDLFAPQFNRLSGDPFFEREEPLKARPNAVLDEDALDGGAAQGDPWQLQMGREPHTAPGRMRKTERHNLLSDLRRGGLGMRLVDGRQVFETLQALPLKAALVVVQLRAGHPPAAAGFADVAQHLGQFQDAQAVTSDFLFSSHGSFSSQWSSCASTSDQHKCHWRSLVVQTTSLMLLLKLVVSSFETAAVFKKVYSSTIASSPWLGVSATRPSSWVGVSE
jgi:hypothetical protein